MCSLRSDVTMLSTAPFVARFAGQGYLWIFYDQVEILESFWQRSEDKLIYFFSRTKCARLTYVRVCVHAHMTQSFRPTPLSIKYKMLELYLSTTLAINFRMYSTEKCLNSMYFGLKQMTQNFLKNVGLPFNSRILREMKICKLQKPWIERTVPCIQFIER